MWLLNVLALRVVAVQVVVDGVVRQNFMLVGQIVPEIVRVMVLVHLLFSGRPVDAGVNRGMSVFIVSRSLTVVLIFPRLEVVVARLVLSGDVGPCVLVLLGLFLVMEAGLHPGVMVRGRPLKIGVVDLTVHVVGWNVVGEAFWLVEMHMHPVESRVNVVASIATTLRLLCLSSLIFLGFLRLAALLFISSGLGLRLSLLTFFLSL